MDVDEHRGPPGAHRPTGEDVELVPVVPVAPVVDVLDPLDAVPTEGHGDDQPPPAVPQRGRIEAGHLDRPSAGLVEGLLDQGPGSVGDHGQLGQPGHRSDGDDQAHPARPAAEATVEDEDGGGGDLEGGDLYGQLTGYPAQREAGHGEGLPLHRVVGVDHEDREGNADCEEHPGHPSIKHGPTREVKPTGPGGAAMRAGAGKDRAGRRARP